eukprot:9470222-Pyramimonas_sp.AAC.1
MAADRVPCISGLLSQWSWILFLNPPPRSSCVPCPPTPSSSVLQSPSCVDACGLADSRGCLRHEGVIARTSEHERVWMSTVGLGLGRI